MKKLYFLLVLLFSLQMNASTIDIVTAPEVSTRLTEDYTLEMPVLKPYPIYVNASVESPDTMQEVTVSIDGTVYTAEEEEGFYYYLWTPSSYGNHEIIITAIATSGDETAITRDIVVTDVATTQTVSSLEDVVIEFNGANSRWYYGYYTFPQYVGAYDNLRAFLEVECPNVAGGCDDWDRWAHIDVKAPDGNWIQLIRYITPYGVACNHELDITDYLSLLQGEVELRVFIDTWGTGGWQLTLNLEYTEGAPEYTYSSVVEVWDAAYSFGDYANLQPVETYNANVPEGVATSYLRLSNTGHGWGSNNTGNAAEFFNATHYIDIDAVEAYSQNLYNPCNPNPDGCQPQNGTWNYARAGWCPGAISPPDIFDLTAQVGTSFELDYRFHPTYVDLCHPNHPDCVTGTTCPDCNDGYNPVYFVDGHIINRSDTPLIYSSILGAENIDNTSIYSLSLYPNPTTGVFRIQTDFPESYTRLTINTIEGRQVKTYYFRTSSELNNHSFDLSNLSKGIYFVNLENSYGTGVKRFILD
jgi:hypothetical protein